MRCFLAVRPSDEIVKELGAIQQALREQSEKEGLRLRWTSPENLHITLHFLGECSTNLVSELIPMFERAVEDIRSPQEMQVLNWVVGLPADSRATVLAIGNDVAIPVLLELHKKLGMCLYEMHLPLEKRPFFPHITLARAREGVFARSLTESDIKHTVSVNVQSVVLYRSEPSKESSLYTPLAVFPLPSAS